MFFSETKGLCREDKSPLIRTVPMSATVRSSPFGSLYGEVSRPEKVLHTKSKLQLIIPAHVAYHICEKSMNCFVRTKQFIGAWKGFTVFGKP